MTPGHHPIFWTEAMLETVRQLVPLHGCSVVAKKLMISESVVRIKARRMEVFIGRSMQPRGRIADPVFVAQLTEAWATRATARDLAEKFDIDVRDVREHARRLGLPLRLWDNAKKQPIRLKGRYNSNPTTPRPCMVKTCNAIVASEHVGHRMCEDCRRTVNHASYGMTC